MVRRQDRQKRPVTQARPPAPPPPAEPYRISASTPFDFTAKHLTPYGGLLPVATMLETLGFQALIAETLTVGRLTRVMSVYQFVLALVLGQYLGFARLHQLRFVARDPMLTGILHVTQLPPQSTLWRFLASLHRHIAGQILTVQRRLRERVWAASHVRLRAVTLDTDTTVHTVYGDKMGARKSYNPKNKGKESYQPILTFLAETREYIWGELHNGDRPTGTQIGTHLRHAFAALPPDIPRYGRADSGFYCWDAVAAYEAAACRFGDRRAQDRPAPRRIDSGTVAAVAEHGCGCPMCVPVSAERLAAGVSLRRPPLRAAAGRADAPGRAISAVRDRDVHVPRLCHQHGGSDRAGRLVLQPTGGRGESHQGGEQRRRADGPPVASL